MDLVRLILDILRYILDWHTAMYWITHKCRDFHYPPSLRREPRPCKRNIVLYDCDGTNPPLRTKQPDPDPLTPPEFLLPAWFNLNLSLINNSIMQRGMKLLTQWRHNDHNGVSNRQAYGCLLNRLFRRRSKKTSNLRVAFVRGIHRWAVNAPHKGPVTRKMFPFDDDIMTGIKFSPYKWMGAPEHSLSNDSVCIGYSVY